MVEKNKTRPWPVTALAILLLLFSLLAFLGSLFLWGEGFLLQFPEGVDIAFPITDILVNAPASLIAGIGLWKLRRYGYVASQFVAGFYSYASVEIFVHVAQGDLPNAMAIIAPQVLAVLVAIGLAIGLLLAFAAATLAGCLTKKTFLPLAVILLFFLHAMQPNNRTDQYIRKILSFGTFNTLMPSRKMSSASPRPRR